MNQEEERLLALGDARILDTPPEPEFDDIVELASLLCDTPTSLISFVQTDRQWFKARLGFGPGETPINQSVCFHALKEDRILVIPDLTADKRTSSNPLVTGKPGIRFYAGAVLRTASGQALGSLCVIDTVPRPGGLTSKQEAGLLALGRQTMRLLEMRRTISAREAMVERGATVIQATKIRADAEARDKQRLARAEASLVAAQEAGGVGTFEVDILTGSTSLSAEFCRIYGLDPQLNAMTPVEYLQQLILPEDRSNASSDPTRRDGSARLDTTYRIKRPTDGAVRWINRKAGFDGDADGTPVLMRGTVQDITDRYLAGKREAALARLADGMRDAKSTVESSTVASRILGETLDVARAGYARIDIANGLLIVESDWFAPQSTSIVGQYSLEVFAATVERAKLGKPIVVEDVALADFLRPDIAGYGMIGTRAQIKVPLLKGGQLVGLLYVHSAGTRKWDKDEVAFVEAVADRTYAAIARLEAERDQRFLSQELNHRLKNTLAMVQAIAGQTLRPLRDDPAVAAFNDRLGALGTAHDILMQSSWSTASVPAIVEGTLRLVNENGRISISGPSVMFGPMAALSLSLLLHELSTNALKHGALSAESGRVIVHWGVSGAGDERVFTLRWEEQGGPTLAGPPERSGFGSRLIKMGIAGAGDAKLSYNPAGLIAEFRAPLSLTIQN